MKKPWHLILVGVAALVWNSFGALDYCLIRLGVEAYTQNLPEAQRALIAAYPIWVNAIWALAVWLPVLAALLLLGARRGAAVFFGLSLIGLIISAIYNFLVADPSLNVAAGNWVFGLWGLIFVIAVAEWVYARAMVKRGVLE